MRTTTSTDLAGDNPEDPSRLTKVELRNRAIETVGAVGELVRATVKSSVSQPLQSVITTFATSDKMIVSTDEMLRKINAGMVDLEEALDEVAASLRHAVDLPDPSVAAAPSSSSPVPSRGAGAGASSVPPASEESGVAAVDGTESYPLRSGGQDGTTESDTTESDASAAVQLSAPAPALESSSAPATVESSVL